MVVLWSCACLVAPFWPCGGSAFFPLCDRFCSGNWRRIFTTPGKMRRASTHRKAASNPEIHIAKETKIAKFRPLNEIRGNGVNYQFSIVFSRILSCHYFASKKYDARKNATPLFSRRPEKYDARKNAEDTEIRIAKRRATPKDTNTR